MTSESVTTQTIRDLPDGSPVGSMVSPFAPTSGADVKLSLDQIVTFAQGNFTNNNTNLVLVSPEGVDAPGNGSYENPYATLSYAQTQITTATPTNTFEIFVTGSITDPGQIYGSPNVNFRFALGAQVDNSVYSVIPDPAWATCDPASEMTWDNVIFVNVANLDFSGFSASITPILNFKSVASFPPYGTFAVNGNPSTSGSPTTVINLTTCNFENGATIDNCLGQSVANFYYNLTLGGGTPTTGNQFNAIGDTVSYGGLNVLCQDPNGNSYSFNATACALIGNTTFSLTAGSYSSLPVSLAGCSYGDTTSSPTITGSTDPDSSGTLTLTIAGANKIGTLVWDDGADNSLWEIDATSYPDILTSTAGGPPSFLTNIADGVTADFGLAIAGRNYSWGGNTGATALTFQRGNNGNLTSAVTLSEISGRAASAYNDVFIASDSSGSVIFAPATRTMTMQYTNGGQFIMPSLSVGGSVQDVKAPNTYNTTSTISAADLLGLILITSGSGITLTLPTAAAIATAMTSLLLFTNSTFKTKIINNTANAVTITKTDANLLLTGLTTTTMLPGQTLDLEFGVSNTSTPQVTVYGGINLGYYAPTANPTFTGTVNSSWIQAGNAISTTTRFTEATIVSAPYVMMGPMLANDVLGGVVLTTPTVPLSPFQLPSFTLFEAALAALLGVGTVPLLTSGYFTIQNTGSATTNVAPGSGFNIATGGGAPTILGGAYGRYLWTKDTSSSYALFGA